MWFPFEILIFLFFSSVVFSDNSKSRFEVDESRGRISFKTEDTFPSRSDEGLNNYQQSFGKHNENKESILEPSSPNKRWRRNIFAISLLSKKKQEQPFGGPGEKESSSSTSSNDKHPSSTSTNEKHANVTFEDSVHESADEEEKEICFPGLGCFEMGKPWKSALRPVGEPDGPEVIQTTLHFYSRDNYKTQEYITLYPSIDMGGARFDPKKITVIIVHGFINFEIGFLSMKDAYLKQVDANVMIVYWDKTSMPLNYLLSCANTRVVGRQLAIFVEFLKKNYGADTGKFHLIGHSLGAHICSYLAKEVPGIARLTALDPAQPAFEGFDARVRLDKSDADFVDVIHTNAKPFLPTLGIGMMAPHGHVDFYINGGFDQPGCLFVPKSDIPEINTVLDLAKFPLEYIYKAATCSHQRAYQIFVEALNDTEKCTFWGHKADVTNVLKSVGNSLTRGLFPQLFALSTCTKENCVPLGLETSKSPLRGSFVVITNTKEPYCVSEQGVPAGDVPSREAEFNSWHKNANLEGEKKFGQMIIFFSPYNKVKLSQFFPTF